MSIDQTLRHRRGDTSDSPYAHRYHVPLRAEARRLHREGGWTSRDIVRIFTRDGVHPVPSEGTVRYWLRGGSAAMDRQLEWDRRSKARRVAERNGGRMLGRARTPEFKFARATGLRTAGLSVNAVAKAMSFDFPDDPVSEQQVRYALETGRWPNSRIVNAVSYSEVAA